MPYYKERQSEATPTVLKDYGLNTAKTSAIITDCSVITGFRTRGPTSTQFVEVTPFQADPYAYFLRSDSEAYKAALKARGISGEVPFDRGHPMNLAKFRFYGNVAETFKEKHPYSGSLTREVKGFLRPDTSSWGPFPGVSGYPAVNPSSDLRNFGQRAIAKTAPLSDEFDLARFLGELREGLPRLGIAVFKERARVLQNTGGDYLNVQFGWKPLVDDIKTAARVLLDSTQLLEGAPKQGRPIHRKWGLPPKVETAQATFNGGLTYISNQNWYMDDVFMTQVKDPSWDPNLADYNFGRTSRGEATVTKRLERRQWFRGSYTNFLPLGFDKSSYLERLNVLINTKFTPATLWELAPWTWMSDWALHIGDSIEANLIAGSDTLFINYAYAMESTFLNVYVSAEFLPYLDGFMRYSCDTRYHYHVTETRYLKRVRANPFGFTTGGLSGLSPSQVAILTALGASRL